MTKPDIPSRGQPGARAASFQALISVAERGARSGPVETVSLNLAGLRVAEDARSLQPDMAFLDVSFCGIAIPQWQRALGTDETSRWETAGPSKPGKMQERVTRQKPTVAVSMTLIRASIPVSPRNLADCTCACSGSASLAG